MTKGEGVLKKGLKIDDEIKRNYETKSEISCFFPFKFKPISYTKRRIYLKEKQII